jgi:hypothetical protein
MLQAWDRFLLLHLQGLGHGIFRFMTATGWLLFFWFSFSLSFFFCFCLAETWPGLPVLALGRNFGEGESCAYPGCGREWGWDRYVTLQGLRHCVHHYIMYMREWMRE